MTINTTETPAGNTGLAKAAVQCSADIPDSYRDAVNQTLVLRISPDGYRDGENRHLRQARKRYADTIFIQPEQPLTLVPVLISSIVPTLIASMVFFLFEKYSKNSFHSFRILAIILLAFSFINPFMGIQGVTNGYAIALNFMHVVVVGTLLFFIIKAVNSTEK
jgi:hypothetical protein